MSLLLSLPVRTDTYAGNGGVKLMWVVKMNLSFTILYNLVGLSLAAFGILPPILAAAEQSLPDLDILANSSRLLHQKLANRATVPPMRGELITGAETEQRSACGCGKEDCSGSSQIEQPDAQVIRLPPHGSKTSKGGKG